MCVNMTISSTRSTFQVNINIKMLFEIIGSTNLHIALVLLICTNLGLFKIEDIIKIYTNRINFKEKREGGLMHEYQSHL